MADMTKMLIVLIVLLLLLLVVLLLLLLLLMMMMMMMMMMVVITMMTMIKDYYYYYCRDYYNYGKYDYHINNYDDMYDVMMIIMMETPIVLYKCVFKQNKLCQHNFLHSSFRVILSEIGCGNICYRLIPVSVTWGNICSSFAHYHSMKLCLGDVLI